MVAQPQTRKIGRVPVAVLRLELQVCLEVRCSQVSKQSFCGYYGGNIAMANLMASCLRILNWYSISKGCPFGMHGQYILVAFELRNRV